MQYRATYEHEIAILAYFASLLLYDILSPLSK